MTFAFTVAVWKTVVRLLQTEGRVLENDEHNGNHGNGDPAGHFTYCAAWLAHLLSSEEMAFMEAAWYRRSDFCAVFSSA